MVFQDITENDIRLVEEYISKELPELLDLLLAEIELKYTHKEKMCFFGSYASTPTKFCFAPGESKMIFKLVKHVNDMIAEKGLKHYGDESIVPKKTLYGISMKNSVFGLVYGLQEKHKTEKVIDLVVDTEHHQNILFEKAEGVFKQFKKKKLQPIQEFTVRMVEIKTEGDKIKGKVMCIFCEEKNSLSVFCKANGNLSSHITSKHLKIEEELTKRCKQLAISDEAAAKNDCLADVSGLNENIPTGDSTCEDTLYSQISTQCIKMENLVAHNGEKAIQKSFEHRSTSGRDKAIVKFCRIAGDGDCLFSAIAHQLYNVKIASAEHKQKTMDLRNEVVDYIKNDAHFPAFIHDLKNRISCDDVSDIREACKEFLDNRLSMPRCWGGMESIKAISEMQKVNIVVVNENGLCNLPSHFNINARQSLLLLFGNINGKSCKSNDERSHYESIVHFSQKFVTSIAKQLSEAEKKHEQFLKEANASQIIELE